MPDLLRRVAVLTLVSAVAIGLMAPFATRSATPVAVESMRLLTATDEQVSTPDRAGVEGRARSAVLSLALVALPIGPESLGGNPALATPPSAPMEATLYHRSVKVVPVPFTGSEISGKATWYCCSRGWRGQAVVALPGALGGHFTSPPATRSVTVCADRCAVVPVVDYCGCYWGTSSQRVADLSPEAWAAISDTNLSRGVITVTVHLGG
ncbi:MAG: RlpA-like double-psi beta-barrel domain-containing protein [Chloroflexota bacterium]|nr:RlpA-like double-psi beta-barrel domain-containing protein [Chloroflexota bacterium]